MKINNDMLSRALDKIIEEYIKENDLEKVRHGKWECVHIDYDIRYNVVTMRCPICKRWHSEVYCYGNPTENVNYCSYCGAKMDGDKNV